MRIPNYDVGEEAGRHGPYVVHRGRRQSDQQPVLLKMPLRVPSRENESDGLRHEFELLGTLGVAGIPRAYELIRGADTMCLVLEDSGLAPLSSALSAGRLDLSSFFRMAIQLCAILAELHRRQIVHGGISPASVWVSRDGTKVQLLHVGRGSRLSSATGAPVRDGAAAYMSPEQTGRTSRAVDYRTDFYSLGATFYKTLTGAPPFSSDDSLELIHAHIAKEAAPPALVGVPEQLSRLVLKLLAKAAEDRYQGAVGIRHDLEACEREWTAHGVISIFELGSRDVPEHVLIPQKLYGRGREVEALLKARWVSAATSRIHRFGSSFGRWSGSNACTAGKPSAATPSACQYS